ncbi:hypothetical protein JRO89_XS15G0098100 [Xanthoceras sorbifolium]|uniref:Zinc knuckle CX2CX4HX4C domain-containing protein n=1 Tax=Xanthoceras sorbifolium TaxID=99658 RepID=A0ABQ8H1G7_9ROSI|nr:hypothetical protein JRO89_XS15G0098100 [Xanthoceras sorbifolium]
MDQPSSAISTKTSQTLYAADLHNGCNMMVGISIALDASANLNSYNLVRQNPFYDAGCVRHSMDPQELSKLCETLSISEVDGPRINFSGDIKEAGSKKISLCLVDLADRRWVLSGGPWSFDGALLVLEEPSGLGDFNKMQFDKADFWIQLHNIPLFCMTKEAGLQLGSKVGKVKDIDTGPSGDCMGKFLRIRVNIDVSRPLKRGIRVSLDESEESVMLLIRYERLPEYFFGCGMVGHHVRDCPSAPAGADFVQADNQPFGPWLRASSSGVSRPSRENTGRAAPVTPTGNMAGLGERRLVVATAARSKTAILKKNSDLMAPAMASSAEGERAASMGAAKGVLLRVETAPGGMGKSVATVSLGAGAASIVARSPPLAAQVHGHLAHADTVQVLGHPTHEGAAHVHSHLAHEGAAHMHGPLALEGDAQVHPCMASILGLKSAAHVQPCLALPDGHACDACVHPCTALECALPVHVGARHVQPCVSLLNGRDSAAHVLPCMAQVRGVEMTEEGSAVSFTFSTQADASNTELSPLHTAAMEVDRKHFKWKRVVRMGMVGNGDGVQLSGLGKRAELEPLEGEGSDRVKRSRGSKNEESSLLKLARPGCYWESDPGCGATGFSCYEYGKTGGLRSSLALEEHSAGKDPVGVYGAVVPVVTPDGMSVGPNTTCLAHTGLLEAKQSTVEIKNLGEELRDSKKELEAIRQELVAGAQIADYHARVCELKGKFK